MPGSSMYDLVKQLKAQKEQQNALSGGAGSTALVISPQEFAGSARGMGKPDASPSQLTQVDRKGSSRLVNTVITRTQSRKRRKEKIRDAELESFRDELRQYRLVMLGICYATLACFCSLSICTSP